MNIFIFGLSGKMGKAIVTAAQNSAGITVSGGFDSVPHPTVPTYTAVEAVPDIFDVIIDFSRPALLDSVLFLSAKYSKPVVIATTGHSEEQEEKIIRHSQKFAVLKSGNMSIGINLLLKLVSDASKTLCSSFDAEIIEKHHNQKVDAPSGTAKMLAEKIAENKKNAVIKCGREGVSQRKPEEITIHSVRGGTIVGEHEIIFAGDDEIVTISHTALSRKIFANGALRAAEFLKDKKSGYYTMTDAIADKL